MQDDMAKITKPDFNQGKSKLYIPASWHAKIEFIKRLVLDTNLLIAVLGEKGGGKSTFVDALDATIAEQIMPILISAKPSLEATALLAQLNALLELPDGSTLESIIAALADNDLQVLVIIDDAEFVSDALTNHILDILQAQGEHPCFHVCFVSDVSMTKRLRRFEKRYPDLIHSIELGPLSEEEAKTYMKYRLLESPDFIKGGRVERCYKKTKGRIAAINRQLPAFFNLNEGPPSRFKRFTRRMVTVCAFMGALVLGGVLQLKSHIFYSEHMPLETVILSVPFDKTLSDSESAVLLSKIPAYDLAATQQFLAPVELRRAEYVIPDDSNDLPQDEVVVLDKVLVIPKIIQAEPEVAYQNHYTIQLIASHSRSKLERFARLHRVQTRTKIHRTQKQDRVWYVLTSGDYKAPEEAKEAMAKLPEALVKLRPWIRSMEGLKTTG